MSISQTDINMSFELFSLKLINLFYITCMCVQVVQHVVLLVRPSINITDYIYIIHDQMEIKYF